MSNISKVVAENLNLPIYAWVDYEVVADDSLKWLGRC